jgi:hypothetical protein
MTKIPTQRRLAALLLGFAGAVSLAAPANAITLPPDADAPVVQLSPHGNDNYGGDNQLQVSSAASDNRWFFLKFDSGTGGTNALPSGTTSADISRVTMTLFVNLVTTATGGSVDIYRPDASWTEGRVSGTSSGTDITWNNKPNSTGSLIGSYTPATTDKYQFVTFDITNLYKDWVSGTTTNNGLLFKPNTTNGAVNVQFPSKENADASHQPFLDIVLSNGGNSTLSAITGGTWTGANSITTLGTVTTGTWSGTPIANAKLANSAITIGGSSTSLGGSVTATSILDSISSTQGAVLYRGSTGWSALSPGNASQILVSGGPFADPQWGVTSAFSIGLGYLSLYYNTTGSHNTAVGYVALRHNTTGSGNVAIGVGALDANESGFGNVAVGNSALDGCTTGNDNIAIGREAGTSVSTGNYNIMIGNYGVSGDAYTIRVGDKDYHTAAYVAGIYGSTASSGVAVYVDPYGHLGTLTSSRRFKDDIADMDAVSEAVLSLRPVTFHYKPELDAQGTPQFGLVAEEVAEISPDLVARDAKGEVYTVRYEAVNAMLLNEFQKEHKRVQEQAAKVSAQEEALAKQQKQIDDLTSMLTEMKRQGQGKRRK